MILDDWFSSLLKYITKTHVVNFGIALLILLVGTFIARRARFAVERLTQFDIQQRLWLQKFSYYGLLLLTVAAFLSQLGFDLKVVLGAAGVLTVAIGFAAQTSASNLISGIFLMVERPFVVGDVVSIGDITGEVMTVDLLSTKIRTFANLMVRIPNEKLVKSEIFNYSYFPIRRVDFKCTVGFASDMRQVEAILRQAASRHPLCLEDPKPLFIFSGFNDNGMAVQFQVWTLRDNMQTLQNELYRDIKEAFDANQISIPYPHRMTVPMS